MAAVSHMTMGHRQINKILLFAGATLTTAPVFVYEWLPDSGFGTRLSDGANTTGQNGIDTMASTSDGNFLGAASGSSPFIHLFSISGAGIGTKFSNPSSLPQGAGRQVNFTPKGDTIGLGHQTSPYISAYPVSSSGFGTRYANPSTLINATSSAAAWTPAGNEIVVSMGNAPRYSIYNWSSTGFGTRQTNSYSESSFAPYAALWSSDGSKMISTTGTAGLYGPVILTHSVGNGFSSLGTAASQISGGGYGSRMNLKENAVVIGHSTTPYMSAYQWSNSSGFGTKYANPATLLTNYASTLCFTPSGTDVVGAVTMNPPGVAAYKWTDGGGFGTKYSNPASTTGQNTRGAVLQPFYQ